MAGTVITPSITALQNNAVAPLDSRDGSTFQMLRRIGLAY